MLHVGAKNEKRESKIARKMAQVKEREGEGGGKFYNKCSENSRPQIVFGTDIFRHRVPLTITDIRVSR